MAIETSRCHVLIGQLLLILWISLTGVAAACNQDEFRCTSGQCIEDIDACDGAVHCLDGSDETEANCKGQQCRDSSGFSSSHLSGLAPKFDAEIDAAGVTDSFQCAYGGCISVHFLCNGIKNCADGSDETDPPCTKKKCTRSEFQCGDSSCVRRSRVCNGRKDCSDGSDETEESCRLVKRVCRRPTATCDYGGCYRKHLKCNGVNDCPDGSDEKPELCGYPTTKPPPPTTKPPPPPTTKPPPPPTTKPPPPPTTKPPPPPTTEPPPPVNPQSITDNITTIVSPIPPVVTVMPPPIPVIMSNISMSTDSCLAPMCLCPMEGLRHVCLPCWEIDDLNATCLATEHTRVCNASIIYSVGATVDVLQCGLKGLVSFSGFERTYQYCIVDNMVPVMTVLFADCWGVTQDPVRCHHDGLWRPYNVNANESELAMSHICQPSNINAPGCGQRPTTQYHYNFDFYYGIKNLWPWVVGLKTDLDYMCSGTIISPTHVLTAAHCVVSSQESRRLTTDVRDLRIQISQNENRRVSKISLHPEYLPGVNGFSRPVNDIAIVHMETGLVFNDKIYPACVDLDPLGGLSASSHIPDLAFNRTYKQNIHKYDTVSQEIDWSCYRPGDRCSNIQINDSQFCSKSTENGKRKSLDGGSSGGPYLRNFGTDTLESWRVVGVLSVESAQEGCSRAHTIFTRVSNFKDWLLSVVQ